ncbi:acyl-CoA dehydrogenase family protein [Tatumella citrea]|uniref:Acyl-CoA dehydrogenase n=1 Tax=Tatumella citrea TaxID=53336 RepID=A0A1Y0LNP3_TATCI|nr:acyl-CoA dehydrogenase family protein [Tatumella citrea]ARU95290.1 acyl-CoA dehydrogenase [Tatumella citrea]ARU99330.1 acyl-CoA dehydrogenase [Tatumella citrea]
MIQAENRSSPWPAGPQFADIGRKMAESAEQIDQNGAFPHQNLTWLRQNKLLSLATAQQYGGNGASLATLQQVIAAIAGGEPSTALITCMHYLHHLRLRQPNRWPAELIRRVSESAVSEGGLINSLRVEPELGSPARGGLPQTIAKRTATGWVLNGHKLYTTGIEGLHWLAVWARSDDQTPLVGSWLVPKSAPGISIIHSWDHLGMRGTGSHEVILKDVTVPLNYAADVTPYTGAVTPDNEALTRFANANTALLAAIYDSIARSAITWLTGWLQQRIPSGLGKPLASLPRVHEQVGQIEALLLTNRSLLDLAAREAFSQSDAGLAKATITDNAITVVDLALQLSGNHGLTRDNPLERHYRNVLCGRVHTPQRDSAWILAGRQRLMTTNTTISPATE